MYTLNGESMLASFLCPSAHLSAASAISAQTAASPGRYLVLFLKGYLTLPNQGSARTWAADTLWCNQGQLMEFIRSC